jgi:FdhE protein
VTLDDWLRSHPFLEPIARMRTRIDAAIGDVGSATVALPAWGWDEYAEDFGNGVPLLRSLESVIDLEPAGRHIVAAIEGLAWDPAGGFLTEGARALVGELDRVNEPPQRLVVEWLLGDTGWDPPAAGLLRCAGWLAMSVALRPLLDAHARWRDDDRWLRRYCPACGSLPAMAQLAGRDPGRRRLLSCGCCGSRWRYGRTECPFCEKDSHRLAGYAVHGEGGLRIDHCEACHVYLKTYDGEGDEAVLLADWTSFHLDVVAQDRGLKRVAASLYDLEPTTFHGPTAYRGDSGGAEPRTVASVH